MASPVAVKSVTDCSSSTHDHALRSVLMIRLTATHFPGQVQNLGSIEEASITSERIKHVKMLLDSSDHSAYKEEIDVATELVPTEVATEGPRCPAQMLSRARCWSPTAYRTRTDDTAAIRDSVWCTCTKQNFEDCSSAPCPHEKETGPLYGWTEAPLRGTDPSGQNLCRANNEASKDELLELEAITKSEAQNRFSKL